MPGSRYTYKVITYLHNNQLETECNDVKEVVKAINNHIGCQVVTRDMIYAYFTRPERVNKRVFNDKIVIERTRKPTKGELAHAELAMIDSLVS
eukprot:COSAG02_NODE_35722_length_464_cov_1.093151_1_plen_93_part_00